MANWTKTETRLPTEGKIVDTKVDDEMGLRREVKLQITDGRWCEPGSDTPIQYQPTHWRAAEPEA